MRHQLGFDITDPDKEQNQSAYKKLEKDIELQNKAGIKNNKLPALSVVCEFIKDKLYPHINTIFNVIHSFFIRWLSLSDVRFTISGIDDSSFPGQSVYKGCNQYDDNCHHISINLKDWGADLRKKTLRNSSRVKT